MASHAIAFESAVSASDVEENERALRIDLAAAYRLVALYGWDDLVFTHLSARVPDGRGHFLLNPYNRTFDEITASSLLKVDADGNKLGAALAPVNKAGFVIHSAIHTARADAHAVIHLHTPYGQAVSAMKCGLLEHTQTAAIIRHDVAYHDFEGLAMDLGERERLAHDLGDKGTMILRNHGTLAVGKTVAQAFLRIYFLERACEAQVLMLSAGHDGLNEPPREAIDRVAEQASSEGLAQVAEQLVWPALLRKLDRIDPGFRD